VSVTRTTIATTVGGYTWSITYPLSIGDAGLLQVNAAGLAGVGSNANVRELHRGEVVAVQTLRTTATSPLSGSFMIDFNGQRTDLLPYNASAEEVKNALEGLSTLGTIHGFVQRAEPPPTSTLTMTSYPITTTSSSRRHHARRERDSPFNQPGNWPPSERSPQRVFPVDQIVRLVSR
jgi:hypothetical protein